MSSRSSDEQQQARRSGNDVTTTAPRRSRRERGAHLDRLGRTAGLAAASTSTSSSMPRRWPRTAVRRRQSSSAGSTMGIATMLVAMSLNWCDPALPGVARSSPPAPSSPRRWPQWPSAHTSIDACARTGHAELSRAATSRVRSRHCLKRVRHGQEGGRGASASRHDVVDPAHAPVRSWRPGRCGQQHHHQQIASTFSAASAAAAPSIERCRAGGASQAQVVPDVFYFLKASTSCLPSGPALSSHSLSIVVADLLHVGLQRGAGRQDLHAAWP